MDGVWNKIDDERLALFESKSREEKLRILNLASQAEFFLRQTEYLALPVPNDTNVARTVRSIREIFYA